MARPESQALAGFYACPPDLVPVIAKLFRAPERGVVSLFDPCAGEGEALARLALAFQGEKKGEAVAPYAVELEPARAQAARERLSRLSWRAGQHVLAGDAFLTPTGGPGASLLWLNPPYDSDRAFVRLEERWLRRFLGALAVDGALVFLVPYYALAASADTLGRHVQDVTCWRFPGAYFGAFRQVALVGRRRTALALPDLATAARVRGWAADAESIPELPAEPVPYLDLEPTYGEPFTSWTLDALDVTSLRGAFVPWQQSDRSGALVPVVGIVPAERVADLRHRTFPVAMPPRSAHIASAIAAGVFNGARLEPDAPGGGLPPVLVKGVFDKDWRKVDEKRAKDGSVKAIVEVQQPVLSVTVLDLERLSFHTLAKGSEPTGAAQLAAFTTADLLVHYGRGLLGTLRAHCPVLHDPARAADRFALPPVARPLYRAQEEVVRAAVRLLGGPAVPRRMRRGKAALLLGEIGSGKSSCALAVAKALASRRTLVFCPPHLLHGWTDQIRAVVPEATVRVLGDVEDVAAFARDSAGAMPGEPWVALLSRETAKLGHAHVGVTGACPACGASVPAEVDHAKRRSRCEAAPRAPKNRPAQLAQALARRLHLAFPLEGLVTELAGSSVFARRRAALEGRSEGLAARADLVWQAAVSDGVVAKAMRSAARWIGLTTDETLRASLAEVVVLLALASPEPAALERMAVRLGLAAMWQPHQVWHAGWHAAGELCALLPPEAQARVLASLAEGEETGRGHWQRWSLGGERLSARLRAGLAAIASTDDARPYEWAVWSRDAEGTLRRGRHAPGDQGALLAALGKLSELAAWTEGDPCGEPLFQAVPEPRRVPLATHLARRHKRLFDVLVIDELHEAATDGAAQERAAHRLMALGLPTVGLTGSIMNGYAESLFANFWSLSAAFRAEFPREDRRAFVDRYGYRKRVVEDRDKSTGQVVTFGSMTDRVERRERLAGDAPGVLPLFVLRHLLPIACTLHKADLALDLPACTEERVGVTAEGELLANYEHLTRALLTQIRKDQFGPMAGKLWGQLVDLPSYLDRATADVGHGPTEGSYTIGYPVAAGGAPVVSVPLLAASVRLPKETWLLDTTRAELAAGRNVLVFGWHTNLFPRLARLLEEELGEACPVLFADKVPTHQREAWINREVVGKKRRLLLTNPVCVQTGLNNLVHFATEVFYENPACNPIVYRQALGRVDRIGQAKPTRILAPVYLGTAQEAAHKLLMAKVAVSLATDGLDDESALAAAGAGDSQSTGLSVGKELFRLLTAEGEGPRPVARGRARQLELFGEAP